MTTQITEYSKTEAGLAELRGRLANVVYDVSKPAEIDRARKDRRECVTLRTSLESLRVQLKADVLERGRLIDGEAKRIRQDIEAVEAPIDEQIKKEEARKEAERVAKEKADAERIAGIRSKITAIKHLALDAIGTDAAGIAKLRDGLVATISDSQWGEQFGAFVAEAETARDLVIVNLENMHVKKLAEEAESARIKAERDEFERQKVEQAKRDHEAKVAREAKERADAEARAEAERVARVAQEARERAERERIAAERAALAEEARKAEAERKAQADADRAARAKADAEAKAARDEADRIAAAERAAESARQAEAARVLKEAQDKADAERREVERLQNELLDGTAMLRKFLERYGKRREFSPVAKAITAWLSREEVEQTAVRT